MNFELSDDQKLVREQARAFLDEHCPPSVVRCILEGEEPYDRELWRGIASLGWLGTTIPVSYGGLGLSHYELCVMAEELGRATAPVPFSSSVYFAAEALLLAGSEEQKQEWLPQLAIGEAIGTLAVAEGPGRPVPSQLNTRVSSGVMSGEKYPVPDGDVADFVVVVAQDAALGKPSMFLVRGEHLNRRTIETVDRTRSHAWIEANDAPVECMGVAGQGWELLENLMNRAAVLFAWEQVGGSDAALEQARQYSLERYAFGRPIGSFQAIKHKLAHAYVNNTLARSNCYYGIWALANDAPELPLAAATARVSASQAYYYSSKENIQTHGGMGFTWEFDCQFHYRRAKLLSLAVGSETWWQERLVTAYEQANAA